MSAADESANDKANPGLGGFLIALAAVAMFLSRGIEELGFAREGDPGSKSFPVALAALLLIAGIYEVARWVQGCRREEAELFTAPDLKNEGVRRLGALALSLGIYVWLLGPLGFASATLLFCAPWMRALGMRWRGAVAMTVGLVVLIEVLFAGAFQVRLPEGTSLLAIDRFMINL